MGAHGEVCQTEHILLAVVREREEGGHELHVRGAFECQERMHGCAPARGMSVAFKEANDAKHAPSGKAAKGSPRSNAELYGAQTTCAGSEQRQQAPEPK